MDRENEVSKIFIISLLCVCLTGSGTISIQAERPSQISEAARKENESI